MKRIVVSLALALALVACGKSSGPATQAEPDTAGACALLADPATLFGADASAIAKRDVPGSVGSCDWASADGRRGGGIIVYEADAAKVAAIAEEWDAKTETPLEGVEALGPEAKLAKDLPGYQVQIVWLEGAHVVALLAWSGDPALPTDTLATRLAQAVDTSLQNGVSPN